MCYKTLSSYDTQVVLAKKIIGAKKKESFCKTGKTTSFNFLSSIPKANVCTNISCGFRMFYENIL